MHSEDSHVATIRQLLILFSRKSVG